jgi:glycerol-3-phosphate dehydrogenase
MPNNQPMKRYKISDHGHDDGVEGLISVIGVKLTTARDVAEKAVDLIETKLGRRTVESRTSVEPVYGGAMSSFKKFVETELQRQLLGLSEETTRHLIQTYGSEYRQVLRYCEEDSAWSKPVADSSPVIRAEILHAIREEMACTLDDILCRRTNLGVAAYGDDSCRSSCAEIMAHELRSHPASSSTRGAAIA